jgi:drug/metabolite transporter (DMT)-like permease
MSSQGPNETDRIKYTSIGLLAIPIWGCVLPLLRLASESQGLFLSIAEVQGIAGICGLVLMLYRKQLPLSGSPYKSRAFTLRLLLFAAQIFAIYAAVRIVQRPDLPGVIFCNYLWPSLVLIYSILIAKLVVPRRALFSLGLAIVTLAMFIEFGWRGFNHTLDTQSAFGFILALIAANSWGLYSAITRRFSDSSGGSGVLPIFQLTSALLASLALFLGLEDLGDATKFISWPVLVAGLGNIVAYLCWDIGVRKGNVVTLSLLADFIPWIALTATSVMLGVGIEQHTKLSAAVLVVGALTARFGTIASQVRLPARSPSDS